MRGFIGNSVGAKHLLMRSVPYSTFYKANASPLQFIISITKSDKMRTEDGYIINKCLNGDKEAFGLLVDKYKAGIYALALSKLHDFHDAEDVTQNVFIKAFQKLHTLRRWDSFLAWLCSITYNLCSKHIRSKSRRPDGDFIEDQNPADLDTSYVNSYRNALVSESLHEMYEAINKALESLPENYQQVITLHYFNNMDSVQIAKFLRISPEAVRQRLTRARSELKEGVLNMMSVVFEQQKRQRLHAIFTFRIVEAIKRVRMEPASPLKGLPWGLSLATGVIIAVLSIGTHLNPMDKIGSMSGSPLPGKSKVLKVGEIPVDVIKVSNISVLSNQRWNGTGLGSIVPSRQNAFFMAPQAEGGTWTKKADMPTARMELSASAVNGKIYAIGGWRVPPPLSTVEEYDPTADKWTKKADMPTPRIIHAGCTMNGKIYIVGGFLADKMEATSRMDEYDPVSDKWTRKADMPTPREYLSACAVNGRIYAIGGQNGRERQISVVEEYDPTKDEWTWKTNIPTFRPVALSASTVNGKIYVIGGSFWRNPNWIVSPVVEEYDPATNIWTKKADMPTPREGLSTCVVSEKIYAIGGQDFDNGKLFPTVEEYDPSTDTWTKKADMPTARRYSSTSAINGKIYAIGGEDWKVGALSTVEEYDTGFSGESINFKGKLPTTWGDIRTVLNK
jgi:RNA polymerase sigma factor (sigma-70 family)